MYLFLCLCVCVCRGLNKFYGDADISAKLAEDVLNVLMVSRGDGTVAQPLGDSLLQWAVLPCLVVSRWILPCLVSVLLGLVLACADCF